MFVSTQFRACPFEWALPQLPKDWGLLKIGNKVGIYIITSFVYVYLS